MRDVRGARASCSLKGMVSGEKGGGGLGLGLGLESLLNQTTQNKVQLAPYFQGVQLSILLAVQFY